MPTSKALPAARASSCSAQAVVVPWPPRNAALPRNTASAGGWPNSRATPAPTAFCPTASSRIASAIKATATPPPRSLPRRALRPSVVKKTSSSAPRAPVAKLNFQPAASEPVSATATTKPPTTAGGIE